MLGCETRRGRVTRIGAGVSMWQDRRDEQLVYQDPCENITPRKKVFPKRLVQPLVGCKENCQQRCVTIGLTTIGADRWPLQRRASAGVGWLGRNRYDYSLPDIEPSSQRTLGMVERPGRQGEGSRVGEDQVIDIRILYK